MSARTWTAQVRASPRTWRNARFDEEELTKHVAAQSLDQLSAGHLDVICAVDVFNEGLDLPELDTVLMLRPTESAIVWLQQFGPLPTGRSC